MQEENGVAFLSCGGGVSAIEIGMPPTSPCWMGIWKDENALVLGFGEPIQRVKLL